jgi:protein SCO1/2
MSVLPLTCSSLRSRKRFAGRSELCCEHAFRPVELRRIWTFATGQAREIDALMRAFSVYRHTEGGTISHGLATALINRDGKIEKIWRGNPWTPAEVTGAIQAESK